MKTLAAVLNKINNPLQIEELTIPELKAGQVLVKIAYSGVCHSQLNEVHGLKGEDKFLPHTLGHEGSGVVENVGSSVKKVKPGDHVVLTWIKGMGADVPSALYKRSNGSIVNSGAISTFLTKAVISENRVVKIPDKMPLREAALLGCAIPTGAGIVMNTARVKPSTSVAVFGVGGIGLSALLAAKIANASLIIAIDVLDHKLEQAIQLGATHIINARNQDVLSGIMDITGNRGIDYAIESAGKKESMETAFRSVRNNGGLCVLAGNLPLGEKILIDPFDLIKGKKIIGTWGGETQMDRDIPLYVNMYLAGKLRLDALNTNEYRLEDINSAFDDLEQGKAGRALINMSGE
ncbi:MAG: acetoin dehydrogenase [Candidatus Schekmanbacteria bacterium RIFCSPHIGHO2_02_FULL_38_11]|uniref:Acetoin dehydrogenase n=1 Tax=Candidatus Schekmanbacteria bacterium RIFCSPLOWO2_12_FULL_38_15 TaxID=1817883 RepID=A0A1F7SJI1_9BACT|nr:MAG: acetoin dehydrogenase [Candidatus Schekmanbacteria bacterium GWA2_38_9]OGL50474.1 MAG: acetoin dehydrogenase [Candidatus Schekmanbacteria bacterium RIFCSPLOWO2_02_FULL_38_14]OGL53933.1 MAG: acetoin dehydrogenase [Candidatus Schekmanbacteria bacterium RIFCSPLOWO2_12_FULL_38_15]OGL54114.1 MAG: acetoin dehydrogenase [Candidatus Schekmanbacteria bacterium RIFCSPHIGHO2_02_FULL_38_11]